MESRAIPVEFLPDALIAGILSGATTADPVRLHGAIVAAFEIHGRSGARRDVLFPALTAARELDPAACAAVRTAIRDHLVHTG
ncbi:MAG TPA: hypothetical protein VGL44_13480 [Gaiellales bacterium]